MSIFDYIGLGVSGTFLVVIGLAALGDLFIATLNPLLSFGNKVMQILAYIILLWAIYEGLLACYQFYINNYWKA